MSPLRSQPRIVEHISVQDFLDIGASKLKMRLVAGEEGTRNLIRDKSINRPALVLTGYFKNFATKRIQLYGAGEMAYLRDMNEDAQYSILRRIAELHCPCFIVSRRLSPTRAMVKVAEETHTPLLRSSLTTRDFLATATILLEERFAPRVTEHGTLLDIKGIGTLIRGESGVGKSECALALIERGHSLVADDLVHIRLLDERELIGAGAELNRGYMECRGIGILNIAELFGIRSVRREKRIDLIVTFQVWEHGMEEERTGLERDYFEVLGVQVSHIVLLVRPGRDMARLAEVAAMVEALRLMGHDSAKEFNDRLISYIARNKAVDA